MAFVNVCRFTAASSGTGDFVVSSAVTGYQTPAAAGAVNGLVYRYRAESSDLSQWEVGYGAYTSGTTTLARTTVLYNSAGTGTGSGQSGAGSKTSFSAAPQVAVVVLAEDLDSSLSVARKSNGITPHENLIVKYVSATSVDIDADALVLFDTSGNARRFASINLTAAITTAGANGLDTGSEGSSRWYAIWVVAKADGTVAGLLSESFSAPTMPTDYIYKGFVSAIYNNSSSNFVAILQSGASVSLISGALALSSGTQTSYTAVSLAAYIPPNARRANIGMAVSSSSGTNIVSIVVSSEGSGTSDTYGIGGQLRLSADTNALIATEASILLSTAQQVKYYVFGTNAQGSIAVRGWEW